MDKHNLIVDDFNNSDCDKLADQVNIVDVCEQEGIELTSVGDVLKGLCPLHDEKTPSFTVYCNNTFYCFGCQQGGDSLNLISQLYGYDLETAIGLKNACNHLGIETKPYGKQDNQSNTKLPLPKSKVNTKVNAVSKLDLVHKTNTKLLKELTFEEIKSNSHYKNIYSDNFNNSVKDSYKNVVNNLTYSFPIYDKTEGNYRIKLIGNKSKNPDKNSGQRFKWTYTQNKKSKDKLSYKGNDTIARYELVST